MKTTLITDLTVADICDGFVYNELEGKGLFGWGGKLVIQPEYQRNYIYADGKKDVAVIDWIDGVFECAEDEMCGLEWGRLYETYHKTSYNPKKVLERVKALYADECVKNRRGVFEYVLGGEKDVKLLEIRVFDPKEAKIVYTKQTEDAKAKGISNCPLCAIGHAANKSRIYSFNEMDADHVTAWSKGGATDIGNCQMLCKTHNRAKGNK